jgi:hypothetical protein
VINPRGTVSSGLYLGSIPSSLNSSEIRRSKNNDMFVINPTRNVSESMNHVSARHISENEMALNVNAASRGE